MINFILAVFLLYFILMIFLLIGWRKTYNKSSSNEPKDFPFFTVLVPMRNEANQIINLLNSLAVQDYPTDRFEVIIINDHSDDESLTYCEQWIMSEEKKSFRVVSLGASSFGKKAALTEGIENAQGEWILTTDADCIVPSTWISATAEAINNDVHLISGPVKLIAVSSHFASLQIMDFATLVGVGASTLGWGIPTMCNGANLAYRKKSFIKVRGYQGNDQIASGDDEFLMNKINSHFPFAVRFNANQNAIVLATACESVQDFFQQRIRWAGKWRAHGFTASSALAIFIFFFHATVMSLVPLVWMGVLSIQAASILFLVKLILEAIFLSRILYLLKIRFNPIAFLSLQFCYSFYVIFFGLAANLLRAKWKQRKI